MASAYVRVGCYGGGKVKYDDGSTRRNENAVSQVVLGKSSLLRQDGGQMLYFCNEKTTLEFGVNN